MAATAGFRRAAPGARGRGRSLEPEKQPILFDNTARSVGGASLEIQRRNIDHCRKADPAYGVGVELALIRGVSPDTPDAVI